MQCDVFDRRLNDLLDRRASPASDPLVRDHVACCERCRTVLRVQGQLNGVVQRLEKPVVESEVVSNRILAAAVDAEKDSCRRIRENSGVFCVAPKSHDFGYAIGQRFVPLLHLSRRCAAVMPALAALLLLGVVGWLFRHTQHEIARSPSLVQNTVTDESASALGGQARPTDPISWPSQTSMLAMHQPLLGLQLLSQVDLSDTYSLVSKDIDVPRLNTKWMTVLAHEMAPVQQSMASALNLLRRTLASFSPDETSIDG